MFCKKARVTPTKLRMTSSLDKVSKIRRNQRICGYPAATQESKETSFEVSSVFLMATKGQDYIAPNDYNGVVPIKKLL